ncbi:cell division protein FtsN [Providencia rettgeri]|uniref:cell division protein FtsN n=1 Tax=Providencia rettgeri TaxID=587 RepID=UPI0023AB3A45|nr:cell division protein FtsN [Providencia rettgeri]
MAQKDYVARGRSAARKKGKGKSKKAQGLPMTTLVVAVAIVALFVGGLFYITHNKKDAPQPQVATPSAPPGSTLPPKPEERWRYIKELERRGVDLPSTQQPNSDNNILRPSDLTPEQRQLLEQMDSDRRQPVTNLQEVPSNGKPVPRSQVIINEPAQPIEPVQRKPVVNTEPKPETRPAAPIAPVQPATPAEPKSANNMQNMLVQCGSFRTTDQAESVRATLAFAGIESRVTEGGGWHRIVLGPYSKSTAEKMRDRAAGVGVSGCILRASGG